jgi:hypothetical protein
VSISPHRAFGLAALGAAIPTGFLYSPAACVSFSFHFTAATHLLRLLHRLTDIQRAERLWASLHAPYARARVGANLNQWGVVTQPNPTSATARLVKSRLDSRRSSAAIYKSLSALFH